MPIKKWNPLDPLIRTRHAIEFYNGNRSKLANAIGIYSSQITRQQTADKDGHMPPLHAFRLREVCPEIIAFCEKLEKDDFRGEPECDGSDPCT